MQTDVQLLSVVAVVLYAFLLVILDLAMASIVSKFIITALIKYNSSSDHSAHSAHVVPFDCLN